MRCPRRDEIGGAGDLHYDPVVGDWLPDKPICRYCGSLKPEDALALMRAGAELVPTDKNYKVYIGEGAKFYFQHFNAEQREEFQQLHDGKKLRISFPGFFYVLPYFLRPRRGDA